MRLAALEVGCWVLPVSAVAAVVADAVEVAMPPPPATPPPDEATKEEVEEAPDNDDEDDTDAMVSMETTVGRLVVLEKPGGGEGRADDEVEAVKR